MRTLAPTSSKKWSKSRTVWVNSLAFAVSALMLLAQSDFLASHPQAATFLTGLVVPVVNVVLRFLTDTPITVEGDDIYVAM